jgi:putative DNA primase/helicase
VDLRTGQLRKADPDDGITKSTADTPAESAECPLWLKFLDEATGSDRELIQFLKEWCGYALTGITREHTLVFIYGPGGNGKSVFLNVLTAILSGYGGHGHVHGLKGATSTRQTSPCCAAPGW